jgi:hypothetical protein
MAEAERLRLASEHQVARDRRADQDVKPVGGPRMEHARGSSGCCLASRVSLTEDQAVIH